MRILTTGGAGFVGSAVVRQYIDETDATIINVDKLTYASNPDSLGCARDHPRHHFECVDICDRAALANVFRTHQPDAVVHLAAESHVDRSIDAPAAFLATNVDGTYTLLEVTREYWETLSAPRQNAFRLLHVSTDEVYGDIGLTDPPVCEGAPVAPSSPYAASKAAAEHLVNAWHRTYGLPVLVSNCTNNYGPCQFPEKLVPLVILNALERAPLPVYGAGDQRRDWLFVDDHARALRLILEAGEVGRCYHVGGGEERVNIDVVRAICACLDASTRVPGTDHAALIEHVADRPGHDVRYALDTSRIRGELGWAPTVSFEVGLERTVDWYLDNPEWIERVRTGAYRDWLAHQYGERRAHEGAGG